MNRLFFQLYNELGSILTHGDDAFITDGPKLVKEFFALEGFLDGIETLPATTRYTRKKIIGEPGAHVIRYMEWPANVVIPPHEHNGRPCFEIVTEGSLNVWDWKPKLGFDDVYQLHLVNGTVATPGHVAVVDPRKTQIHSVHTLVLSRSLHFYPMDATSCFAYVNIEGKKPFYYRREFPLVNE